MTVGPQEAEGFTPGVLFDQAGVKGADGSVPGLYNLTQSFVEQLLKDTYVKGNPHLDDPLAALFNGLRDGISLSLAIIEKLVQAIIGQPGQLFLNIDHANTFLTFFMGGITDQLTAHTESIANLNEVAAGMNTTVAYVGDLQDMVTGARADLVTIGAFGDKSTDILAGVGIPLILNLSAMPIFKPNIQLGSSVGDIYYSPIVVDRNGTVDKIRWIAGTDTSIFSIQYYEVALCVYNPVNRAVEKVWGSGNIKDTVANTSVLTEVEIPMGITQTCKPGQILFFAHQQTAPGLLQASRGFAAKPLGSVARPSTMLLDAACYRAPLYSQGIPSTIQLSTLTRENRFIPWGAVSVITPVLS